MYPDGCDEQTEKHMPKIHWTRWYYGLTHLVVKRSNNKDVATIQRFPSGGCTLWMYNTADENPWTDNPTDYYESVEEAMKIAEKRYGVKGIAPTAALPSNHPNNPF